MDDRLQQKYVDSRNKSTFLVHGFQMTKWLKNKAKGIGRFFSSNLYVYIFGFWAASQTFSDVILESVVKMQKYYCPKKEILSDI